MALSMKGTAKFKLTPHDANVILLSDRLMGNVRKIHIYLSLVKCSFENVNYELKVDCF